MKKHVIKDFNHGLCFSPTDSSLPYLEHVVRLLGFDTGKAPTGLWSTLLNALAIDADWTQLKKAVMVHPAFKKFTDSAQEKKNLKGTLTLFSKD
jgi:hypothetical protein